MKSVIVAQYASHANALMAWGQFDPTSTDVVLYGEPFECLYKDAFVARPIDDVTEDQAYWIACTLKPQITGNINTFAEWKPFDQQEEDSYPYIEAFNGIHCSDLAAML